MQNPIYVINGRTYRRCYCSEFRLEKIQEIQEANRQWMERYCLEVSDFGYIRPSNLKQSTTVEALRLFQAKQYQALFEILFTPEDGQPLPSLAFYQSKDFEHEAVHQALADFFLNINRLLT